jgi:hypothetical protein
MFDLNIHNDTSWNVDVRMMLFFNRILRGIRLESPTARDMMFTYFTQ